MTGKSRRGQYSKGSYCWSWRRGALKGSSDDIKERGVGCAAWLRDAKAVRRNCKSVSDNGERRRRCDDDESSCSMSSKVGV
jgi:hypothetical protein